MTVVLHYLQFLLDRMLYPFRGHDSGQIIYTPAFKSIPKSNMILESPERGPSLICFFTIQTWPKMGVLSA
jgi:hypothetical protein